MVNGFLLRSLLRLRRDFRPSAISGLRTGPDETASALGAYPEGMVWCGMANAAFVKKIFLFYNSAKIIKIDRDFPKL